MRHSLVLIAAAVALLVPGASYAADTSAHGSARQVRQCTNQDLRASYTPRDAATMHRYGVIALENVSGSACRTGGFGGLSYVGHGDGTQIGAAAERDRTTAARTFVLLPGRSALQSVSETLAQAYGRKQCRPTHVDGFRVYVPNATRSQFVAHPTTGCADARVHLLSHRVLHR